MDCVVNLLERIQKQKRRPDVGYLRHESGINVRVECTAELGWITLQVRIMCGWVRRRTAPTFCLGSEVKLFVEGMLELEQGNNYLSLSPPPVGGEDVGVCCDEALFC